MPGRRPIPVVDLFAGPGGLGEGFSMVRDRTGEPEFKLAVSFEKDRIAHQTLLLRSFFRSFATPPADYWQFAAGDIDRVELFNRFPSNASAALAAPMAIA